jgi:hypothetical protein
MIIFAALLAAALLSFGLIWLAEARKTWQDEILQGITGVKDWRKRLNGHTDRFVALGREPLLARAASKSDDPALSALKGQTLTLYQGLKDQYLALSYAYSCGARAVQQAEAMFRVPGPLKLVTIRRAGQLAEQGLAIKEIKPERYTKLVPPERNGPKPPVYHLEYIFSVCDKLAAQIADGLKSIVDSRAKVMARLATADNALAAATAQYNALVISGVKYQPYDYGQTVIAAARARVSSNIECNPLGALQVCADLDKAIAALTQDLEQVKKLIARAAKADTNTSAAETQYDALRAAGTTYLPFEQRQAAIAAMRAQLSSSIAVDVQGALQICGDLDKAITGLTQELDQAKQQLAAVSGGEQQLAATRQRVAKVRATALTCDWSDDNGERVCWTLSNADSDPDSQLAQGETLLAQARQSLANGQLQAVAGECKQALAALVQADKMVKDVFDAKTAVDEQVPRVRAELAAIHAQLNGITGGESTHEMAQLVERTCSAVDGRIKEVRHLYTKQLFPEALNLLTGTAGNEYGMPIAKLLAQAKELLKLLQQAVQVASTLAKQTA